MVIALFPSKGLDLAHEIREVLYEYNRQLKSAST